jgi:hypothetical protein
MAHQKPGPAAFQISKSHPRQLRHRQTTHPTTNKPYKTLARPQISFEMIQITWYYFDMPLQLFNAKRGGRLHGEATTSA